MFSYRATWNKWHDTSSTLLIIKGSLKENFRVTDSREGMLVGREVKKKDFD